MILENKLHNAAAIGSKLAAEYYGMEIVSESIETNKKNYTRFLIINKNGNNKDYNKASLAITLTHRKGSLAIILNIISFFDNNLTKIESVPIIGEPWHYLFYMDLQFEHKKLYFQLLDALKPLVDKIEILGEYQSGILSFNQIHKST
jgi:prephenate dehydratase